MSPCPFPPSVQQIEKRQYPAWVMQFLWQVLYITYGVYKHLCPVQHDRYLLRAVLVWAGDYLTLNKIAPERPLSKMAIEILCPCPEWELALFCAAPQVPHLRHQYLKICKWATFPKIYNIIIYKNRWPIYFKFANCIRASSRTAVCRGKGGCVYQH
jgi:hypothetical protein